MGERAKRACWACGKELEEGDYCPECLEKRERELERLLEPILRERRRHARYQVSLPMAFQRPRESRALRAEVIDLSKGGLRFSSPEELDEGEVINVLVRSSDGSVDVRAVVRVVRVVRSKPAQCGWEVAAEFAARGRALKMRDRRKHARTEMEAGMSYSRPNEPGEREGLLKDISQGGLRFVAQEELKPGDVIRVSVGETERGEATVEAAEESPEGYVVRARFLPRSGEESQWKGV